MSREYGIYFYDNLNSGGEYMGKKFLVVVMVCFFIRCLLNLIEAIMLNIEFLKNINFYYINTFVNAFLVIILIGSYIYLYKNYEK